MWPPAGWRLCVPPLFPAAGHAHPAPGGLAGPQGPHPPLPPPAHRAPDACTVYNRSPDKLAPLVARGAVAAASPRDVAAVSDVVFTIVGYPQDVRAVVLGPDGLLGGLRPGGIVCDMTTSEPSLVRSKGDEMGGEGEELMSVGGCLFAAGWVCGDICFGMNGKWVRCGREEDEHKAAALGFGGRGGGRDEGGIATPSRCARVAQPRVLFAGGRDCGSCSGCRCWFY